MVNWPCSPVLLSFSTSDSCALGGWQRLGQCFLLSSVPGLDICITPKQWYLLGTSQKTYKSTTWYAGVLTRTHPLGSSSLLTTMFPKLSLLATSFMLVSCLVQRGTAATADILFTWVADP